MKDTFHSQLMQVLKTYTKQFLDENLAGVLERLEQLEEMNAYLKKKLIGNGLGEKVTRRVQD